MLGEIDRDFYCSKRNRVGLRGICSCMNADSSTGKCDSSCEYRHRKWPTLEQFKEEYGEEYPDEGALYIQVKFLDGSPRPWGTIFNNKAFIKQHCAGFLNSEGIIVCACTPWGKPDKDWRP